MPDPAYAIRTRNLRKRFGRTPALRGLTLDVPRGSIFGLIGPNGAGKSTTARILLDVVRPTSGLVSVLDTDPRRGGAALRRRIGYLPGDPALDPALTGRGVLRLFCALNPPRDRALPGLLAERLGLDLSRRVRTLSTGNRQKLAIVQAFCHQPELLVLDEPTSGLDPLVQQEFLALVREARDNGATVLFSSHVLSEIDQVADRAAVLRAGELVAVEDTAALRNAAGRRLDAIVSGPRPVEIRARLDRLLGPGVLTVRDEQGRSRVTGVVPGSPDGVLKILTTGTVEDLVLDELDLEDSILRLYADDPATTEEEGR